MTSLVKKPQIGRRTGIDIIAGRSIRKLEDGFEDFNDYWSDSDVTQGSLDGQLQNTVQEDNGKEKFLDEDSDSGESSFIVISEIGQEDVNNQTSDETNMVSDENVLSKESAQPYVKNTSKNKIDQLSNSIDQTTLTHPKDIQQIALNTLDYNQRSELSDVSDKTALCKKSVQKDLKSTLEDDQTDSLDVSYEKEPCEGTIEHDERNPSECNQKDQLCDPSDKNTQVITESNDISAIYTVASSEKIIQQDVNISPEKYMSNHLSTTTDCHYITQNEKNECKNINITVNILDNISNYSNFNSHKNNENQILSALNSNLEVKGISHNEQNEINGKLRTDSIDVNKTEQLSKFSQNEKNDGIKIWLKKNSIDKSILANKCEQENETVDRLEIDKSESYVESDSVFVNESSDERKSQPKCNEREESDIHSGSRTTGNEWETLSIKVDTQNKSVCSTQTANHANLEMSKTNNQTDKVTAEIQVDKCNENVDKKKDQDSLINDDAELPVEKPAQKIKKLNKDVQKVIGDIELQYRSPRKSERLEAMQFKESSNIKNDQNEAGSTKITQKMVPTTKPSTRQNPNLSQNRKRKTGNVESVKVTLLKESAQRSNQLRTSAIIVEAGDDSGTITKIIEPSSSKESSDLDNLHIKKKLVFEHNEAEKSRLMNLKDSKLLKSSNVSLNKSSARVLSSKKIPSKEIITSISKNVSVLSNLPFSFCIGEDDSLSQSKNTSQTTRNENARCQKSESSNGSKSQVTKQLKTSKVNKNKLNATETAEVRTTLRLRNKNEGKISDTININQPVSLHDNTEGRIKKCEQKIDNNLPTSHTLRIKNVKNSNLSEINEKDHNCKGNLKSKSSEVFSIIVSKKKSRSKNKTEQNDIPSINTTKKTSDKMRLANEDNKTASINELNSVVQNKYAGLRLCSTNIEESIAFKKLNKPQITSENETARIRTLTKQKKTSNEVEETKSRKISIRNQTKISEEKDKSKFVFNEESPDKIKHQRNEKQIEMVAFNQNASPVEDLNSKKFKTKVKTSLDHVEIKTVESIDFESNQRLTDLRDEKQNVVGKQAKKHTKNRRQKNYKQNKPDADAEQENVNQFDDTEKKRKSIMKLVIDKVTLGKNNVNESISPIEGPKYARKCSNSKNKFNTNNKVHKDSSPVDTQSKNVILTPSITSNDCIKRSARKMSNSKDKFNADNEVQKDNLLEDEQTKTKPKMKINKQNKVNSEPQMLVVNKNDRRFKRTNPEIQGKNNVDREQLNTLSVGNSEIEDKSETTNHQKDSSSEEKLNEDKLNLRELKRNIEQTNTLDSNKEHQKSNSVKEQTKKKVISKKKQSGTDDKQLSTIASQNVRRSKRKINQLKKSNLVNEQENIFKENNVQDTSLAIRKHINPQVLATITEENSFVDSESESERNSNAIVKLQKSPNAEFTAPNISDEFQNKQYGISPTENIELKRPKRKRYETRDKKDEPKNTAKIKNKQHKTNYCLRGLNQQNKPLINKGSTDNSKIRDKTSKTKNKELKESYILNSRPVCLKIVDDDEKTKLLSVTTMLSNESNKSIQLIKVKNKLIITEETNKPSEMKKQIEQDNEIAKSGINNENNIFNDELQQSKEIFKTDGNHDKQIIFNDEASCDSVYNGDSDSNEITFKNFSGRICELENFAEKNEQQLDKNRTILTNAVESGSEMSLVDGSVSGGDSKSESAHNEIIDADIPQICIETNATPEKIKVIQTSSCKQKCHEQQSKLMKSRTNVRGQQSLEKVVEQSFSLTAIRTSARKQKCYVEPSKLMKSKTDVKDRQFLKKVVKQSFSSTPYSHSVKKRKMSDFEIENPVLSPIVRLKKILPISPVLILPSEQLEENNDSKIPTGKIWKKKSSKQLDSDYVPSKYEKRKQKHSKKTNKKKKILYEDEEEESPTSKKMKFEQYEKNTELYSKERHEIVIKDKIVVPKSAEDGFVRRSQRARVPPCQYWKNERVKYTQDTADMHVVGVMQTIYPTHRKTTHKKLHNEPSVSPLPPTEIWVSNPDQDEEVLMHCIQPGKLCKFHSLSGETLDSNSTIAISKCLRQKHFGSGIIVLRHNCEKGMQYIQHSSLVFYILKGHVKITIHETTCELKHGDSFFVPKGNAYNLTNMSKTKGAELYYVLVTTDLT